MQKYAGVVIETRGLTGQHRQRGDGRELCFGGMGKLAPHQRDLLRDRVMECAFGQGQSDRRALAVMTRRILGKGGYGHVEAGPGMHREIEYRIKRDLFFTIGRQFDLVVRAIGPA